MIRRAFLAATMLATASCTATPPPSLQDAIEQRADEAQQNPPRARRPGPAVYHDGPYIGRQAAVSTHGDPLPARVQSQGITISSGQNYTLATIAARITEVTGIPTRVEERRASAGATQPAEGGVDPMLMRLLSTTNGMPPLGQGLGRAGGDATAQSSAYLPSYSGPLSSFLDQIASRFDIEWTYRAGTIEFQRYAVRTFMVKASPTTDTLTNTVSGSTGTSSGSTGNVQNSESTTTLDIWGEVEKAMKALIPSGGEFHVSPSSSRVLVVAPPQTMRRVERYFAELNAAYATSIAVSVTAIFVDVTDDDDYGFSLNAMFRQAASGLTLGFRGMAPQLAALGGTGSLAILEPTGNGALSHFAGTSALVRAVSSAGRLADYRTASTITQNGKPMPITLTTDQDVLRNLQFNTVAQAGAATTATDVETVTYGFSLQLLPRMVGPDEISLTVSLNHSDISSITERAVGPDAAVELVRLDKRGLNNQVIMRNGETLVNAGYEMWRAVNADEGVGHPKFMGLGGRQTAKRQRVRIVLMVTPYILDRSGSSTRDQQ